MISNPLTDWKTVEENTKESFRLCKNDIINFGVQLAKVQQAQRALAEEVGELKTRPNIVEGKIDLSGINTRIDKINFELAALREHKHDDNGLAAEVKDLRKRYDALLDVTKDIMHMLGEKKPVPQKIIRVLSKPKIIKIAPKSFYIASKATMRVHDKHCPFARNIKRKTKVVFKSRMTAFKRGYRACKCLK